MRLYPTLTFSFALLALVGCDRANTSEEQGQAPVETQKAATSNSNDPTANATEFMLESESGMTAKFSRTYAGDPAPAISFKGADGRDVTLQNFAGRPLLVNIWATWCAPCKAEMPTLDALAEREAGRLSVIAISQDSEGKSPVPAFFKTAGIANLEPYTDKSNHLSAAYQHQLQLPTTILFDADGNELWRVTGGVEWDDDTMAELIAEAFSDPQ